jgi:DNA-binding MarR family transcriptional regulator
MKHHAAEHAVTGRYFDEVFDLLIRILPVMHKKIHRDIFRTAIEQSGEYISPHHLMILKMLRESSLVNISEIGEEIAISQSQMTHSTDKLIKLGMIKRQGDARDRRKVRILLTAKGKRYMEKMDPVMRNRLEAKLSLLSANDLEKLAVALQDTAAIFAKLNWE